MEPTYIAIYSSPLGLLEITGTATAIKSLYFIDESATDPANAAELPPLLQACFRQLDEYFEGRRQVFDLALAPDGTAFQKSVWQRLMTIPYGQTVSYLDIAQQLGNEKAIRAVGRANGQNPISIIVPCHRVIGRDGKLVGYGGGLWRKEWLLRHEEASFGRQLMLM